MAFTARSPTLAFKAEPPHRQHKHPVKRLQAWREELSSGQTQLTANSLLAVVSEAEVEGRRPSDYMYTMFLMFKVKKQAIRV